MLNTRMQYAELSRLIENLIRVGTIIAVDHAAQRCRVKTGGNETDWLAWIETRAGNVKTWSPPSTGEQCLVFSPSGELANGFVLTGLNSNQHPAPSQSDKNVLIELPDGGLINYQHDTSALSISGIKTLTVNASEKITLDCPSVEMTGDVIIDGLHFNQHIHTGDDGGNTSAPTGNAP